MRQTILDILAPVQAGHEEQLRALLADIDASPQPGEWPSLPFASIPHLHFASLVLLVDDTRAYPPYLVFELNFDGELEDLLERMCDVGATGLHEIYRHCAGYRATGPEDRAAILAYLRGHLLRPNAAYVGASGRTVRRIDEEQTLKTAIEEFLDTAPAAGSDPVAARRGIQEFVRARPDFGWAAETPPRITAMERFVRRARLDAVRAAAVVAFFPLAPLVAAYVVTLRIKELTDPIKIPAPNNAAVAQLLSREGRVVQNHMASVSIVKPGPFRRLTLRAVLWAVNVTAGAANNGQLSGLDSLHFAHWVLIDGGRRMLFLTNYDGSWENYLDDFIDQAARGLTGIWSNTINFPRTRYLLFGGALDEPRFKAVARNTQVVTNVWYSAYDRLTVRAIDNNSSIREGLYAPLNETATRRWLWRF